jgi:AraC-like DNA-binding protein
LRQALILAVVPLDRLQRLRAAEPEHYHFLPARSWEEAVTAIRHRPVEMAVVDPLFGGEPRTHEIERLRLLFPSLPLVIYTALAPEVAAALLALGSLGIRRALFQRFDDAPATLRGVLRAELAQSAARKVMQALDGRLAELPERLRWALEAMVHSPTDSNSVTALASRAQMTRRTCERWFARSGLPSPRTIVLLSRLLYAHRLLLDPGYTVEDVAVRLGFGKAKSLQTHLREVFGLTAGELRIALSFDAALEQVTCRYFPPRLERVAS